MKQITIICLIVSIFIGTYEKTKQKNLSKQVAITINFAESGNNGNNSIQQQGGSDMEAPTDSRIQSDSKETNIKGDTTSKIVSTTDRPSDESIIKGKKNGEILWRVYTLESSKGKNDGCKLHGKFNGFGYRQNTRESRCYEFFEEVVYEVDIWFEQKLQTYNLAEALCGYNLGFQNEHFQECVNQSPAYPYYKNYMSL